MSRELRQAKNSINKTRKGTVVNGAQIERSIGRLEGGFEDVKGQVEGLRADFGSLKRSNTEQHATVESKLSALDAKLDKINEKFAEQRGAERVWRWLRHAVTAMIAAAVSFLSMWGVKHL